VLVVDQELNIATGGMKGDVQCVTQLFGDPEAAAKIVEKTKPISAREEGWW